MYVSWEFGFQDVTDPPPPLLFKPRAPYGDLGGSDDRGRDKFVEYETATDLQTAMDKLDR
jgi:hypothetical protein